MLRILAIALLISIGAAGVTAKLWLSTRDDLTKERLRAEQLDGQLAALAEREQRRAEGEAYRVEVRSVANSEEWGAVAVPDNVKRVLCKKANCSAPKVPQTDNSSRE